MRTHSLEGRKRGEQVGEFENMARQKRGLTDWRGGRGRSGLVSSETWHVTKRDSLAEGENREERVGELRNMARHKRGLTPWRGGRERSRVGELGNVACHKRLETRIHKLERKREERVGELGNVARHKRGLTNWRGEKGGKGW